MALIFIFYWLCCLISSTGCIYQSWSSALENMFKTLRSLTNAAKCFVVDKKNTWRISVSTRPANEGFIACLHCCQRTLQYSPYLSGERVFPQPGNSLWPHSLSIASSHFLLRGSSLTAIRLQLMLVVRMVLLWMWSDWLVWHCQLRVHQHISFQSPPDDHMSQVHFVFPLNYKITIF